MEQTGDVGSRGLEAGDALRANNAAKTTAACGRARMTTYCRSAYPGSPNRHPADEPTTMRCRSSDAVRSSAPAHNSFSGGMASHDEFRVIACENVSAGGSVQRSVPRETPELLRPWPALRTSDSLLNFGNGSLFGSVSGER